MRDWSGERNLDISEELSPFSFGMTFEEWPNLLQIPFVFIIESGLFDCSMFDYECTWLLRWPPCWSEYAGEGGCAFINVWGLSEGLSSLHLLITPPPPPHFRIGMVFSWLEWVLWWMSQYFWNILILSGDSQNCEISQICPWKINLSSWSLRRGVFIDDLGPIMNRHWQSIPSDFWPSNPFSAATTGRRIGRSSFDRSYWIVTCLQNLPPPQSNLYFLIQS
jgi:hypothetical protein